MAEVSTLTPQSIWICHIYILEYVFTNNTDVKSSFASAIKRWT